MGRVTKTAGLLVLAAGTMLGFGQYAFAQDTAKPSFITLGTAGGPIVWAERSQPANLLVANGHPYLVDCGDGAVERLAGAGYRVAQVNTLFISHLHLDHIGGVQGLIGLRGMNFATEPLTIYGPPGTDEMVAGILQSLQPSTKIGLSVRSGNGNAGRPPAQTVKVVIINDGSDFTVDGIRVRTVRNSHFDDAPGHPTDTGSASLSYRFDLGNYAIGYTGDTGPSDAVARLEKNVDVLVSEVIDLPSVIASVEKLNPNMTEPVKAGLITHLETQHLTPQQAGSLAAAAGVHHLVFTHLGIVGKTDDAAPTLIAGAKQTFNGAVSVAHDLDKF